MTHGKAPDDSELQALYRAAAQAAGDEPDARLDARILAAARAASSERQARRQRPPAAWWKRWLVPVSVTAVAVLGVSLSFRVNEEQPALEAARQMAEAPPAQRSDHLTEKRMDRLADKATDQSTTGSPAVSANALPDETTARPAPATVAPKKEQMPEPASPSPLPAVKPAAKSVAEPPPPPAAPPSPPRDLPAEFDASFERKARREIAAPAPSGQPPSPTLDDRTSQAAKTKAELLESSARRSRSIESDRATSAGAPTSGLNRQSLTPPRQNEEAMALEASPERWLEKIRALRRANRLAEAQQELDRFRQRYPDFALPADLK